MECISTEYKYYPCGALGIEKHYKNGELHRENAPAAIFYNHDGVILEKLYYNEGKLHNENGPAVVEYDISGNCINEVYVLDEKTVSKDQIEKRNLRGMGENKPKMLYIIDHINNITFIPVEYKNCVNYFTKDDAEYITELHEFLVIYENGSWEKCITEAKYESSLIDAEIMFIG